MSTEVRPGQRIRVTEKHPVAAGFVRWVEGDAVCVQDDDGREVLFARGDMAGLDEYDVEVTQQPVEPPAEPPVGTHWLGVDGCVYTHFHESWNKQPWCGPDGWDMTWAEVCYRASPLTRMVPVEVSS